MFGTSGIRGRVGEEITADLAVDVGRAVASSGASSVVVGRDVRASGAMLVDAVTAGLREGGADVIDVDVASTPTIARSVGWRGADAGISITASHNPPEDNGIKLWSPSGQAFDADEREEISRIVETGSFDLARWDRIGRRDRWPRASDRHRAALRRSIDRSLGTSVVVDVGNGTGGLTADVLVDLGCDVETINAQPDGRFPGRPSEPTAETCATLCSVVEHGDADLGIAHDGDADRMMAVAADGTFVGGDELLALFGRDAVRRGAGDTVVAPLNTSLAVDDALASVGGTLSRTRVGDVHVAEEASNDGVGFGGEPSGAWIWPDETLCPDGPLAACRLVALVANRGPISDQLDSFDRYPIRRESVRVESKPAVMDLVAETVADRGYDANTMDGIRVDLGDSWFLIRPSGTEPVVRITAEARDRERAEAAFEEASGIVAAAVER